MLLADWWRGRLPARLVPATLLCLTVSCSKLIESDDIVLVEPRDGGRPENDGGTSDAATQAPESGSDAGTGASASGSDAATRAPESGSEAEAPVVGPRSDAATPGSEPQVDAGVDDSEVDAGDGGQGVPAAVSDPDIDAGSAGPKAAVGEEDCPTGFSGATCDRWKFIDITAGKSHTCGLLEGGAILCWGNDAYGQVSGAPTNRGFVALQSGGAYSCGIRRDGTVLCWGSGGDGILDVPLEPVRSLVTGWDAACAEVEAGLYDCWGNDANTKYSARPTEPVQDLQIGWQQGCALLSSGRLDCWGANEEEQATPPTGSDFVAFSLASWHGCGQHEDGSLECWGLVHNAPSGAVVSMSSRGLSTCAVMLDESIRCWGAGGALDPPTEIQARKLAVGDGHSCALVKDGSITCWGQSTDGAHRVPAVP